MLTQSVLLHLAREKGHRVHEMDVPSAVEHIFNETVMQARAQASNRLAKANRASHGPRVMAKERARSVRENPKVPKVRTRVKPQKRVYPVLKTRNRRQVRKLRHLHRLNPLTILTRTISGAMMAGVRMNGMMTGVRLDGMKTTNKPMTIPQAHFHLEVFFLGAMSNP